MNDTVRCSNHVPIISSLTEQPVFGYCPSGPKSEPCHLEETAIKGRHGPRLTVRSLGFACPLLKPALIRYDRGGFSNEDQQRGLDNTIWVRFFSFDSMATGAAFVVSGAVGLFGKGWKLQPNFKAVFPRQGLERGKPMWFFRVNGAKGWRPEVDLALLPFTQVKV